MSTKNNSDLNPFRKLLVLGLNEVLDKQLLSLDWDGKSDEPRGHLRTKLAGYDSVITWTGISCGEIRFSVWWKYDHDRHPQANLTGNSRESFIGTAPLAKRVHYPKFVGVVCGAWLERKDGKYLQGRGSRGLLKPYSRKGEIEHLKGIPNPVPNGFAAEGKFHN